MLSTLWHWADTKALLLAGGGNSQRHGLNHHPHGAVVHGGGRGFSDNHSGAPPPFLKTVVIDTDQGEGVNRLEGRSPGRL